MHAPVERVHARVSTLLRLAWPLIVSRSSQVVIGLADALMVAHLGQAALAATTTGAMNAYSLFILPMGIAFIVSSFSSQYFGRGDLAGARRYGFYGLALALGTQLVCLGFLPFLGAALGLFEFAPDVLALLRSYLAVRLLSGGAVIVIEGLANYYGGIGNTRLPMIANLWAMVLNVGLTWLLINGHLGVPAMGVTGAAWASTISTWMAAAGLLAVFLLEGRRAGMIVPRLHGRELLRMLRFGLPSGLNWFFEFFAFMFFVNVVVGGLGTTALAALMSVIQLNSVSFMPAFALASAGAIVVGQAIGARAFSEVPRAAGLTFLLAAAWQVVVGVVYLFLPRLAFMPFARGEGAEALLEVGARMLMVSVAWQLFDAAASTLAEALRAAGDTAFTLWARLALAWVVFVPGSLYSVRVLGAGELGAMWWLVAYLGMLAGILFLRFRAGAWRRIQLVEA